MEINRELSLFEQWNKCNPMTCFKKQGLCLCLSDCVAWKSEQSIDVVQPTSLFISFLEM